ncbi:DTW domain-containing protein, partial [Vibrio cholerae]|nr:DTW domain-containing protein [Vibrio cholerae]
MGHVENLYWRKSPVVSKIAAIFPPVVRAMRIHAF